MVMDGPVDVSFNVIPRIKIFVFRMDSWNLIMKGEIVQMHVWGDNRGNMYRVD